jgi:hypothetical protein
VPANSAGGQLHHRMTGFTFALASGLSLAGAVETGACGTAHRNAQANPAMIVLLNATDVHWFDIYDGQVHYKVPDGYPANRSVTDIQTRLERLGWHPRERDFLNPGGSSATKATWGETQVNGKQGLVWSQQWENSAGDVVWYGLRYSNASKDNPNGPLDVSVSYLTNDTIRSLQMETQRSRDQD